MKSMTWTALGTAAWLTACASGPPTRLFLLGTPASTDGPQATDGVPIPLQTVLIPDYLDTTDILARTGPHEITASPTGRWGERLSQGITHALQADLAAHMPGAATSQLLVTVDAFDAWTDGHCVLTAHWTWLGSSGGGDRGVFTSPPAASGPVGDAGLVTGMAASVDLLATHIAADLQAGRAS